MSRDDHGPAKPAGLGVSGWVIALCVTLFLSVLGVAVILKYGPPQKVAVVSQEDTNSNMEIINDDGSLSGDSGPSDTDRQFVKQRLKVSDAEIDEAVRSGNYWRYERDAKLSVITPSEGTDVSPPSDGSGHVITSHPWSYGGLVVEFKPDGSISEPFPMGFKWEPIPGEDMKIAVYERGRYGQYGDSAKRTWDLQRTTRPPGLSVVVRNGDSEMFRKFGTVGAYSNSFNLVEQ